MRKMGKVSLNLRFSDNMSDLARPLEIEMQFRMRDRCSVESPYISFDKGAYSGNSKVIPCWQGAQFVKRNNHCLSCSSLMIPSHIYWRTNKNVGNAWNFLSTYVDIWGLLKKFIKKLHLTTNCLRFSEENSDTDSSREFLVGKISEKTLRGV